MRHLRVFKVAVNSVVVYMVRTIIISVGLTGLDSHHTKYFRFKPRMYLMSNLFLTGLLWLNWDCKEMTCCMGYLFSNLKTFVLQPANPDLKWEMIPLNSVVKAFEVVECRECPR